MEKTDLKQFTSDLQKILNRPWNSPDNHYIRLDQVKEVNRESLSKDNGLPPTDPFIDAFNLIIEQAQNLFVDHINLGLNEVLKSYLKKINQENEQNLTSRVMECIRSIFVFISKDSFPYTEKIWGTLSSMAKPVGIFLIQNGFASASALFFEFIADLGKQAARQGLSTGTLQHGFRVWELNSRDNLIVDLESQLRNLRQNLES